MKPLSLPLVPFLLVFVLGVHAAFQEATIFVWIDISLAICLLCYFSFFPPLKWWNFFLGIGFFVVGFYLAETDQWLTKDHYSHVINLERVHHFEVAPQQCLYASSNRERFYVKLIRINGKPYEGRLLLTLTVDPDGQMIDPAKRWIIKGQLYPITPPLNPGAFDYKNFLRGQNILHQLKSHTNSITTGENSDFSFHKYQAYLSDKINQSGLKSKTASLLQTMLLGERSKLDPTTRTLFTKAKENFSTSTKQLHHRWNIDSCD